MIPAHNRFRVLVGRCAVMAWVLLAGHAWALDPQKLITQFVHRKWGAADGIGPVNSIAQTPDGYLWLGSSNGLFRYDGKTIKRWEPLAGDPAPPISLAKLLVAHDGSLWCAAYNSVCRLRDGHLQIYGPREALLDDHVVSLFEDHEGAIWVGTTAGLSRFEHGHWEKTNSAVGFPEGAALAPCMDKKGTIWLFSLRSDHPGQLFSRARGESRFQPAEGDFGERVSSVAEGPDGRLWVGNYRDSSTEAGVHPILPDRAKIRPEQPTIHVQTSAILFDRDGGLWISTYGTGAPPGVADLKKLRER